MKRIAVIPNTDKDINLKATKELVRILNLLDKEVLLDESIPFDDKNVINKTKKSELSKSDMIVVLGGDGTILEIAEDAAKAGTPILGINLGNLGFLTQAESVSEAIFSEVFDGNYSIRESMMLRAIVCNKNKSFKEFTALNDIVFKGEAARMINVRLDIDGTNTNNYPADGVIIATATGSTAYSLSAGGAIVHPELNAIMITPICPHTLKARCMIIPDTKTVDVSFSKPYRNSAVLNVDGKRCCILEEDDYVRIEKSEHKVKFINLNNRTFYDIIREKIADRSI